MRTSLVVASLAIAPPEAAERVGVVVTGEATQQPEVTAQVGTHCTMSNVCLPSGDCAPMDDVLYVSPHGGNFGTADNCEVLSNTDLHLTALSPKTSTIIVDDIAAAADCQIDGKYIDDFDGQPRPVNGFCDRGADEYRPWRLRSR